MAAPRPPSRSGEQPPARDFLAGLGCRRLLHRSALLSPGASACGTCPARDSLGGLGVLLVWIVRRRSLRALPKA